MSTTSGTDVAAERREVARRRLYHWNTGFEAEVELFPGLYPRSIVRGDGAYLVDDTGHRLLDCGHSVAACSVGHARAEVAERMAEQLRTLEFTTLDGGLTHPHAVELADRLGRVVPVEDAFFFFNCSGSEANDMAFKVARAYHAARGEPGRVKVVCREDSYHGSTFGAMSATGVVALREPYAPLVPGFVRASAPVPGRCGYCERAGGCTLGCANDVERVIRREGPGTVAAFIGEPVSVAGNIGVPHPGYWQRIREICDASGVLLIADEVINGFGRLGRLFGCDRLGIRPDVMTLAKGLTSGYVPMGATVVSGAMREAFRGRPLPHNATNMGHPLGCAAALAVLEIVERDGLADHVASLEGVLRGALTRLASRIPAITATSSIGLLASLDVATPPRRARELALRFRHECYERGFIPRFKAGDDTVTVFFYPPLVVTEAEVEQAMEAIGDAIARWLP
ncbi:MAG: aminotransferase class III-fold pyridoxal phosphate-dependent enzyme [Thermoleophilia bacterium]